jgi:NAD(P)-dependent dehydrogenase (short-subunit alcohol dehydrogenase family)
VARVFITGSSDGLGLMVAQLLVEQGHRVVLHARNAERSRDAAAALPTAEAVLTGDVSSLAAMKGLAQSANELGRFDAVVHNVGVGFRERHVVTGDGLSRLWAINVLAPYVLTALMMRPSRLIYLSSGMHNQGAASLDDPQWRTRSWNPAQAYSDSKLQDVLLAFAVARRWPDVAVNAMTPGWVATRMGGPNAYDDLDQGHRTQAWLAVSDDTAARSSGGFYYHLKPGKLNSAANDVKLQDALIQLCETASGIALA